MVERCWNCATPVRWSAEIGDFCPNPICNVVDALDDRDDQFDIRIFVDAPATAAIVPRTEGAITLPSRRPASATL